MKHSWILPLILLLIGAPLAAFAQHPSTDSVALKALSAKITAASKQGDYEKTAALLKQLVQLGKRDSSTYYALALFTALSGDKAMGRKYIDTAIALGKHIGEGDPANMILGLHPATEQQTHGSSFFTEIEQKAHVASEKLPTGYANRRLFEIFYEDQHEREPAMQMAFNNGRMDTAYLLRLSQEDAKHRAEVYAMLKQHSVTTAKDLEEGAFVLQHGDDSSDYWTAHTLAMRSVKLGNDDARWLAAATLDRYLESKGRPQKYGTQSIRNPTTGKLELYKVDPTVTDSERAKWHVPPLKDAMKPYKSGSEKK